MKLMHHKNHVKAEKSNGDTKKDSKDIKKAKNDGNKNSRKIIDDIVDKKKFLAMVFDIIGEDIND